jgi:hypothetical protein
VDAHRSLLHVTNGDSVVNTLRQTTIGGAVVAWKDTLHEGPVPEVPRHELLQVRAAFLAEAVPANDRAVLGEFERRDTQLLDALVRGDEVVLWFEHDLYDQLQLVDALGLAHGADRAPELIVVDSYFGELSAHELQALWPTRTPATHGALCTAASVWAAFRSPDPTALVDWASRAGTDLPFLPAALARLLEELPAPADGLSRTERSTLEVIAAGARTPLAAFAASQQLEEARFLGDTWFFRTLSGLRQGLVDGHELRLTPMGERVLRGEEDRVDVLGIDRWLGGTHLTRDNVWRWDGARLSRD